TSTVIIGNQTGNANLLVGTTTYGGGLNSNFTLNGNDVLVQGQLGSIEGLFSATGVSVGTGTTVYGDGNLYKTTSGDFTLALNNTASNWRFRSGGRESFTVASTGNVGIGVTTPLEALDVSGTMQTLIRGNLSLTNIATTTVGASPYSIAVQGKYAYVVNLTTGNMVTFDVSTPSSPVLISTILTGSQPHHVVVNGRYAYVANSAGNTLQIIDVSNPANPITMSTVATGASPRGVYVSGRYAYVVNFSGNTLQIFDVSDPTKPLLTGSVSTGAGTFFVEVQGKYAYVGNNGAATLQVVDVSDPKTPRIVGATASLGSNVNQIVVQGRYVYVSVWGSSLIDVVDVSNPTSPTVVATRSFTSPARLAVFGRYLVATTFGSPDYLGIYDISNPASPQQIAYKLLGDDVRGIAVSGRNIFVVNSAGTTMNVLEFDGLETSALLAHSAELGNLSVLTNATVNNQLTVGGGLVIGSGGILSQGSLAISSTNTTSTFVFAVSSSYAEISNRLTVGGKSVCLQDGTNCQSSSSEVPNSAYIWTDSPTNNTIYPTTSTRDVLLGGSTTNTAAFIFDQNTNTSTVIIGNQTGNANLLVGTTTYGGGLNSSFVMNGNDVIVQGMLGSMEGLYSATGVRVGTGTTVYGDGNLYKTTSGDFTLALNDSGSSYRFRSGGQESFTVASSGFVGIGVSTPLEALDVSGTIRNLLPEYKQLSTVTSTYLNATQPYYIAINGNYAYVTVKNGGTNSNLSILDITNKQAPVLVGSLVVDNYPAGISVQGKYAYITHDNGVGYGFSIIDVSNPSAPYRVSRVNLTNSVRSIFVSGRYAYLGTAVASKTLIIMDISNPANPVEVSSVNLGADSAYSIQVQGRYAYLPLYSAGTLRVVDVADPKNPVAVGSITLPHNGLYGVAVQGRYAYVGSGGWNELYVIDVSNPASMTRLKTVTTGMHGPWGMSISGRYLYVANYNSASSIEKMVVFDIASSTNPILSAFSSVRASNSVVYDVAVSGKYAFTTEHGSSYVSVVEIEGVETSALLTHSAELGSLQVLTNGTIYNQLTVGGGLTVGPGGILSQGSLAISSTNTTSTFVFAVSSSYAEISNRLTVGGVGVCLGNGANCPSGTTPPAGANAWSENNANDTAYLSTSTRDLLLGGSTTATAGFIFDKGDTTSTVIIGSQTGIANLLVGTTTYGGGLNSAFTMSGNDVIVQGMLGSLEGLYSATGVRVGTGTTVYGDGNLYKTTSGDFSLALNDANSNWRFRTGAGESFTVASTGNIGIGVSTPMEALDVKGSIQTLLRSGNTLETVYASTTITAGPVAVFGRYAYTSIRSDSYLTIVDVSEPSSAKIMSSLNLSGAVYEIAPTGRYVYVAATANFFVVDTLNPSAPSIAGSTGDDAIAVKVKGKYAFVVDNAADALKVIDVGDPTKPELVASVATYATAQNPAALDISGDFAYVINTSNGTLAVFDISDPTNPVRLSTVSTGGSFSLSNGLVARGRYVYLAANSDIRIMDVQNPLAPVLVKTVTGLGTYHHNLAVEGRYLFTTDNYGVGSVLDVSDPPRASLMFNWTVPSGPDQNSLAVSGRYLYLSTSYTGTVRFMIYDIGGLETNGLIASGFSTENLQVLGSAAVANRLTLGGGLSVGSGGILTSGSLAVAATTTTSTFDFAVSSTNGVFSGGLTADLEMAVNGNNNEDAITMHGNIDNMPDAGQTFNVIYTTTTSESIYNLDYSGNRLATISSQYTRVLDISDPTNLEILGRYSTPNWGQDVDMLGDVVFALRYNNTVLHVLDFANPASPAQLDSYTFSGGTYSVSVDGGYAYVAKGGAPNSVYIFDISDLSDIKLISTQVVGSNPQTVLARGDYVYVNSIDGNAFQIINVADRYHPYVMSTTTGGGVDVVVQDNYAYTSYGSNIRIYDISNPSSPVLVKTVVPGGSTVYRMAVDGNILHVAANTRYVQVDITDPVNASVIGYTTLTNARSVVVKGRYAYVGSTSNFLYVIDTKGTETNGINAHSAEFGNLRLSGSGSVNGDFEIGESLIVGSGIMTSGELVAGGVSIFANLHPKSNDLFDLGSAGYAWNDVYVVTTYTAAGVETNGDLSVMPQTGTTGFTKIATVPTGNQPNSFAINGDFAYVIHHATPDSFSVVDISDPSNAKEILEYALPNPYLGWAAIEVRGNYLFIGSYEDNCSPSNLMIFDISNPKNPVQVATACSTSSYVRGIALDDDHMYVTGRGWNAGNVEVFNISDPANPMKKYDHDLAAYGGYAGAYGIAVQGKYLYVTVSDTSYNRLHIYDVSDENNVRLVGVTANISGDLRKVYVNGNYAYIANTNNNVHVVDVSSSTNPYVVTSVSTGISSAYGIVGSGDFMYVSSPGNERVVVFDVSNPRSPVYYGYFTTANDPYGLAVKGRYVFVAPYIADGLEIWDIKGAEVNGLIAHSAELGSLSVRGSMAVSQNLAIGGSLAVGNGGIRLDGALSVASTNTASVFQYAVSSSYGEFSSDVTLRGVSVCLQNGTNCPAGASDLPGIWVDNKTNGTVYLTTSTRDVLLGSNSSVTAGFMFDFLAPLDLGAIFSLKVGNGTSLTNLYVGTSTYDGGLNSGFTMSGNEMLVQGKLGSIEGLFSATGVSVGTGTTVYGDGNLYKTTAGDFNLSMNNAASNLRIRTNETERLTVASSGNIGIGVATPLEALDVNGSIKNTVRSGQTLTTMSNRYLVFNPQDIAVSGRFGYMVNYSTTDTSSRLSVVDLSDPTQPTIVGSYTEANQVFSHVRRAGRYALVYGYSAVGAQGYLVIFDVSDSGKPVKVGSMNLGSYSNDMAIGSRYAYLTDGNKLFVVDYSDPTKPFLAGSYDAPGTGGPTYLDAQGDYVYLTDESGKLYIFDVSNPRSIKLESDSFTNQGQPYHIKVSGHYAYINDVQVELGIYDISNPSDPQLKGTVATGTYDIDVSGKYAFFTGDDNYLKIADISNPANPQALTSINISTSSVDVVVSGRYAYVLRTGGNLAVVDIGGAETNGILAASAEVGSLQVLTDGVNVGDFDIGGGLSVGSGIHSNGPLTAYATGSFMNDIQTAGSMLVGATGTSIGERLQVEGNLLVRRRPTAIGEAWTATGTAYTNVPSARQKALTVWTGSKMIVWGGDNNAGTYYDTGGIYDPMTDSWTSVTTTNAPQARSDSFWAGGIWTGSKMIVWGGSNGAATSTGGIYDPSTDTWKSVTSTGAPSARYAHVSVWTGSKMIVWGGTAAGGGVYDPMTDTWLPMSTANAPTAQMYSTAVWATPAGTSSKMIVFSGLSNSTAGMYDPANNTWTTVTSTNSPSQRYHHAAVWTGTKMIVWGGYSAGSNTTTGGMFDPVNNTWASTTQTGAGSGRRFFNIAWGNGRMMVWGGYAANADNTGALYDPVNDSWTTMTTTNAPIGRYFNSTVWTGTKMIVWGGTASTGATLNSGSTYTPTQYQGNLMV
ncbi:MAG: hypothetical protein RDU25_06315, partial [Patescibacteria group bacterium]|nr:hypothetical protein [Patescibacteria group bacterium]